MLPLEYLQELGVVPAPASPLAQGPCEELLAEYRRYLLVERQLSEHTVLDAYVPAARLFLEGWERPDGLGLERLSAADVSMFLARECPKRSVSKARDLVCALRSFLRYLHLAGVSEAPLVWAVPWVADLRDRTLSRGLEPAAVRELLASCDRRTLVGRRDQAILLLLSRLELRAGEVAAITLDDVDWGGGLLLVHGKGSRQDLLPLPVDVGEAIVSYLRRRPQCECRALFLRVNAPRGRVNRSTVAWVVRAACDRAGLPRVGAHRLWHTAATEMQMRGVAERTVMGVMGWSNTAMTTSPQLPTDDQMPPQMPPPTRTHDKTRSSRRISSVLASVGGAAGDPVRGGTHRCVGRPVTASVGQYVS